MPGAVARPCEDPCAELTAVRRGWACAVGTWDATACLAVVMSQQRQPAQSYVTSKMKSIRTEDWSEDFEDWDRGLGLQGLRTGPVCVQKMVMELDIMHLFIIFQSFIFVNQD